MYYGYYGWFTALLISAGGAWVWLKLVTRTDPNWKYKGHHWYLYILAGVGSAFLSLAFYQFGDLVTSGGFYSRYAAVDDFWFFILINGPAEEWAKFLVYLIIAKGLGRVKEPRDGVLVAMMVALGFSLWENIYYIIIYGNIGTRLVISSSGHMAYAAIWGYFSGEAILQADKKGWMERNVPVVTSVFVLAFIHGFFNFLITWVSFWAGLSLKAVLYVGTLTILYNVCQIPSAYRTFSYEESDEAIKSIRKALARDQSNVVLWKRLGFYELYLGRDDHAIDSWKQISEKSRGPYLNAWLCILTGRSSGDSERSGFERYLGILGAKGRSALRRRLRYFLKQDATKWLKKIDQWESRMSRSRHRRP